MKKWLLLLLCMPLAVSAADGMMPKQKAEEFLSTVKTGKVVEAYDALFAGSSIPADKPQAVTVLKQQTQSALPLYGKILGHELVREEKFGASLVRLMYLLKSDKHPTVWELYFYKPGSEWFLSNLLFSDQFQLLDKKNERCALTGRLSRVRQRAWLAANVGTVNSELSAHDES